MFESHGWEIDLLKRELRIHGSTMPIGSRAFEIIETLVEASGDLVTKDALMRRVWPGLVVEDNTVQVHISAIRKALGADRGLLKTVSGRGYRLMGRWAVQAERRLGESEMPPRQQPPSPHFQTNVPVAASALVGRETAVKRLFDLISAYRIVTLTGPGGIGKTVLAAEVARRIFPGFSGDVMLAELVSLTDADLLPTAVAQALGLRIHGDGITAEAVARAIGDRRMVLVLDNCEHLIDAAAAMAEALIRMCPSVSVLATSQELLRVDGEVAYRVPPLDVPEPTTPAMDGAPLHSAVQLFLARIRSLRAELPHEPDRLPTISAICRHLDGIPLAIEFAAARAATLGIDQVASRLDDRFTLLTSGRRTAMPRHQTLRATLDWSYELLPERERRLLRHLAIFPAGFTLDAVMAVAGETESSVALGISSLMLKSLVAPDGAEAAARWRLLETVRIYALEKLDAAAERPEAMRRLVMHCLALFGPFGEDGALLEAIAAMPRYRRETDTLRVALRWALAPDGAPALGVELAATVCDFWVADSLVAEAGEWAEAALRQIASAAGGRAEMMLRCSLGFATIYTEGMHSRARDVLLAALDLAHRLDAPGFQQRIICGLWLFSARSMALKDALAYAHDYGAIARDDDMHTQATAAWMVGIPMTYMARHAEASERLAWAVRHHDGETRRRDMMWLGADMRTSALSHDTVNLVSRGLLETAVRTATTAVEEARETKQPFVLCVALAWASGFVSLSLDALDDAGHYGEELVTHAAKHGLAPFEAAGLCVRGSVAARRGGSQVGVDLLRQGLAGMRNASYMLFYPFFLLELAKALGAAGRLDEAMIEADAALSYAAQTDYRWLIPEMIRVKGELALHGGPDASRVSEALFQRALAEAGAQNALYWEVSAAASLAALLRREGRGGEAVDVLEPIYGRFTEGLGSARLTEAKGLLDELSRA